MKHKDNRKKILRNYKTQNYYPKFNFLKSKIEDRKDFLIHSLQTENWVYNICKLIHYKFQRFEELYY